MGKERTTVSLDERVAEHVSDDDAPFSPLVNKWAEDYYLESRRPVMKRARVKRMLEELDEQEAAFEEQVQATRDLFSKHRGMLKEALGEAPTEEEDLEDAIEDVYNRHTNRVSHGHGSIVDDYSTPRDPENPAMRNAAQKLGITPEHLVEELRRRDRRDGFEAVGGDE